ncbi:acetyltransferase [Ancylomarina salipaludis]|uniref:Acetyltransferase n=1 Tax=Ancylomarina salipaludis TaxID=2501299 RepID=A0A4Q1JKI7_9BACT|nr:acetyltransferase [Ancylomarina salipaludis]RXQ93867.1 acetyltransferase [Ancylomarina salipaludis]
MKNLLIIGARGFGREIYNLALQCPGYKVEYQIKGFLDDKKNALNDFTCYPPIVNSVEDYVVCDNDVFVCALGDIQYKKKYIQIIKDKGGDFITLIHPSANIHIDSKIGVGSIVLQNATLGSGSIVGDFALIQVSTIIGHDVKVGNYSRIDCHVVCTGGAIIEDEVTIYTSAVINQNVRVEKGACVGAVSFVLRRVKEYTTVHGNPAVRLN